jgi:hypothetical protein
MVCGEGAMDVATISLDICGSYCLLEFWKLMLLEPQLGLVVPINCDMFVSVGSGCHKL